MNRYERDLRNMDCPLPVIETKKLSDSIEEGEMVITVNSETARENLKRFAASNNLEIDILDHSPEYIITLIKKSGLAGKKDKEGKGYVVLFASDKMGHGDDELGSILVKGYVYSLTELDYKPETIIFYNSAAKLTCEGSPVIEDLLTLSEMGIRILTCGTCLKHFGIEDKLRVGEVSNMYTIAETLAMADKVVKP